jgi:hypothetical protein
MSGVSQVRLRLIKNLSSVTLRTGGKLIGSLASRVDYWHPVPPSETEGADLSRSAEAPDPGRDHPGMVGDIISERWARSSRTRLSQ